MHYLPAIIFSIAAFIVICTVSAIIYFSNIRPRQKRRKRMTENGGWYRNDGHACCHHVARGSAHYNAQHVHTPNHDQPPPFYHCDGGYNGSHGYGDLDSSSGGGYGGSSGGGGGGDSGGGSSGGGGDSGS
ncbi:hypothetical protein BS50DRAFT_144404 [Corynespora cassiicola Philippines]|uniref:Uncharacterized protein n=1 Tax=Corynespora cassiicola Philippines TaxID=1448308 RepID=A0A2T2N8D5_CORCC|nr:hypothetical protein BS50DRAFT_144404 [Corynespora cassiicola Philippines]